MSGWLKREEKTRRNRDAVATCAFCVSILVGFIVFFLMMTDPAKPFGNSGFLPILFIFILLIVSLCVEYIVRKIRKSAFWQVRTKVTHENTFAIRKAKRINQEKIHAQRVEEEKTKQQAVEEAARQKMCDQYLAELEKSILTLPKLSEVLIHIVDKYPIPRSAGIPVANTGDIDNLLQKLIRGGSLQGIAWNGMYFGTAAIVKILHQLEVSYPEISSEDLQIHFYDMPIPTLQDLIKRLRAQNLIDFEFDAARGAVVFQRAVREEDLKQLYTLIRAGKQVDLAQAEQLLRIPRSDIKRIIYTLAGEGTILGKIVGDVLTIESDVGIFIDEIGRQFEVWEKSTEKKEKKA